MYKTTSIVLFFQIKQYVDCDAEGYIFNMSKNGVWGNGTVLSFASKPYERQIIVHQAEGNEIHFLAENENNSEPLRLCYVVSIMGRDKKSLCKHHFKENIAT